VLEVAHAVGQLVELREGLFGLVDDGALVVELRVLREVADLGALGDGDDAGVGNNFAGEDFEECRLAGAVGADEPEALALFDIEAEAVKDDPLAEGLFEIG
jgi:hypothetical protein